MVDDQAMKVATKSYDEMAVQMSGPKLIYNYHKRLVDALYPSWREATKNG